MILRFDEHGHAREVTPRTLLDACSDSVEQCEFVRRLMFRSTPQIFPSVSEYCDFVDAVSELLKVHPHNVHVRGSSLFGFSITPRAEKVWKPIDKTATGRVSDIDVAVADVDLYSRWCELVDAWEKANPLSPSETGSKRQKYLDRWRQRRASSISSKSLPGEVGHEEKSRMGVLDTARFCGRQRKVTALVFRDWQSLEARCVKDLQELRDTCAKLPEPPELRQV